MTEEQRKQLDNYIEGIQATPLDSIIAIIYEISRQILINSSRYSPLELEAIQKTLVGVSIGLITKSFLEENLRGSSSWLIELITRIQEDNEGFDEMCNFLKRE